MADAYQMLTRDEASEGVRRHSSQRDVCAWIDGSCVSCSPAASLTLSGSDERWLKCQKVLQGDEKRPLGCNFWSLCCVSFVWTRACPAREHLRARHRSRGHRLNTMHCCSTVQLSCALFPDPQKPVGPKQLWGGMILQGLLHPTTLNPVPDSRSAVELARYSLWFQGVMSLVRTRWIQQDTVQGSFVTVEQATVCTCLPSQNTSVKSRETNQFLDPGYTKQPPGKRTCRTLESLARDTVQGCQSKSGQRKIPLAWESNAR